MGFNSWQLQPHNKQRCSGRLCCKYTAVQKTPELKQQTQASCLNYFVEIVALESRTPNLMGYYT
jgi:hypothetical protein